MHILKQKWRRCLLSRLTDFADRPAGTSALYAQEMSSGGEKQHLLVPQPPQVLDEHLVTPVTPSGTFCQLLFFPVFGSGFTLSPKICVQQPDFSFSCARSRDQVKNKHFTTFFRKN